jgi:hypothetical protein
MFDLNVFLLRHNYNHLQLKVVIESVAQEAWHVFKVKGFKRCQTNHNVYVMSKVRCNESNFSIVYHNTDQLQTCLLNN